MLKFDQLFIFGDSFCMDHRDSTDWPVKLAELLRIPGQVISVPGSSWWSLRQQIYSSCFKKITNKSLIIILHTEPVRIPNDHSIPANPGVLHNNTDAPNDRIFEKWDMSGQLKQEIINHYSSPWLFSSDFYEWAQQAWIREINQTWSAKKIIHIPCFRKTVGLDENAMTVVRPAPLFKDLRSWSDRELPKNFLWEGIDSRHNHFRTENNIALARALFNIVNKLNDNSNSGLFYFDNDSDWVFTGQDTIDWQSRVATWK